MSNYSNKTWICPYYKYDRKLSVTCEGGKVFFPSSEAGRKFTDTYCASFGYKNCCIAQMIDAFLTKEG